MRKDLEQRLVKFSISVIDMCDSLGKSFLAEHLSKQILRSSSSAALNYGEAQGSISNKEFVHKLGLVEKELRESYINLKIISGSKIKVDKLLIDKLQKENDELIAIIFSCVKTAKKKL